jgi:hypothetical protein
VAALGNLQRGTLFLPVDDVAVGSAAATRFKMRRGGFVSCDGENIVGTAFGFNFRMPSCLFCSNIRSSKCTCDDKQADIWSFMLIYMIVVTCIIQIKLFILFCLTLNDNILTINKTDNCFYL